MCRAQDPVLSVVNLRGGLVWLRFGRLGVVGGALCGVLRLSARLPRGIGQPISGCLAGGGEPRSLPLRRYESPFRERISAW
jgi:hypothetical protein